MVLYCNCVLHSIVWLVMTGIPRYVPVEWILAGRVCSTDPMFAYETPKTCQAVRLAGSNPFYLGCRVRAKS